jgi:hypothetical protein
VPRRSSRQLIWVVLELVVGEAEGAVAGPGVDGVAGAVVLEGASRAVVAPGVGLDDQTVFWKEEVDLSAG